MDGNDRPPWETDGDLPWLEHEEFPWEQEDEPSWASADGDDWSTEGYLDEWPEDLAGPEYWLFKRLAEEE